MPEAIPGIPLALVANVPSQVPLVAGGVTLINQGAVTINVSPDEHFTNPIGINVNSSLPWPGGGTLWAVATANTQLIIMDGLYNYTNSSVSIAGGIVNITGAVTLAPGTTVAATITGPVTVQATSLLPVGFELGLAGVLGGAGGLDVIYVNIASLTLANVPTMGATANLQLWNWSAYLSSTTPTQSWNATLMLGNGGNNILDVVSRESPSSNRLGGLIFPNGGLYIFNEFNIAVQFTIVASPH
jgi:hypothetical protein